MNLSIDSDATPVFVAVSSGDYLDEDPAESAESDEVLWALWNVTYRIFYTNGFKIELLEEDDAFATACGLTTSGPIGGPVWRAVPMTRAEAAAVSFESGLQGVYAASGIRRRALPWSDPSAVVASL